MNTNLDINNKILLIKREEIFIALLIDKKVKKSGIFCFTFSYANDRIILH